MNVSFCAEYIIINKQQRWM